ncbi:hypothetical protein P7C73_g3102, partial [Tremellales sp. Uapishka_1]
MDPLIRLRLTHSPVDNLYRGSLSPPSPTFLYLLALHIELTKFSMEIETAKKKAEYTMTSVAPEDFTREADTVVTQCREEMNWADIEIQAYEWAHNLRRSLNSLSGMTNTAMNTFVYSYWKEGNEVDAVIKTRASATKTVANSKTYNLTGEVGIETGTHYADGAIDIDPYELRKGLEILTADAIANSGAKIYSRKVKLDDGSILQLEASI